MCQYSGKIHFQCRIRVPFDSHAEKMQESNKANRERISVRHWNAEHYNSQNVIKIRIFIVNQIKLFDKLRNIIWNTILNNGLIRQYPSNKPNFADPNTWTVFWYFNVSKSITLFLINLNKKYLWLIKVVDSMIRHILKVPNKWIY
jgi:hypothetical protein